MIQGDRLYKKSTLLYLNICQRGDKKMIKIIDGWLIETIDGTCYRLLITHGHYVGLRNALCLYHDSWYAKKTTGLKGTEKEIIDSINESDKVTVKFEFQEVDGEEELSLLQVIDKDNKILFTYKDIRTIIDRVYRL